MPGLLVILFCVNAWADVSGLVVWQPEPGGVRYVVPKLSNESPEQLMAQWNASIKKSSIYRQLENTQKLDLSAKADTFQALPQPKDGSALVEVVFNRPNQMMPNNAYIKTVIGSFEQEGNKLLAVPVGLETVLSEREIQQFQNRLNNFDGQLGVGGDDPHPKLYDSNELAPTRGDISFKRDIAQSRYMLEYIKNGKGRVFYVCGSHQRLGLLDGYDFHADIGGLTDQKQLGPKGKPVVLEVVADARSELAIAAGDTRFKTSNYHHAAINEARTRPGRKPVTKVTAYNIESNGARGKIVKAIELPGNRGFATQFHPEFRQSEAENKIVHYVSTGWKMRGRYPAQAVVRCLSKSIMSLAPRAAAGVAP